MAGKYLQMTMTESVRRAVVLAQPLPLPPPGHPLLGQFVNPNLRFKPNE